MPNWCFNELTIKDNSHEILSEVKKFCIGSEWDKDKKRMNHFFDFNRILKMPESMNIECGSRTDDSCRYYCMKNDKDVPKASLRHPLRFSRNADGKLLSVEEYEKDEHFGQEEFELGHKVYTNLVKYGFVGWYDWAIENWGTKWNSCDSDGDFQDVTDNEIFIQFDTAWTAPFPVIMKLSEDFPTAEITLHASYEGGDDDDVVTYKNGFVIHEEEIPHHDDDYDEYAE